VNLFFNFAFLASLLLCRAVFAAQATPASPPFSLMNRLVPSLFDASFQKQIQDCEFSAVREELQKKIAEAESCEQKAELEVVLATVYIRDQKEEEAFQTFLQALCDVPQKNQIAPSKEELQIYESALPIYLEQAKCPASDAAVELESKLEPVLREHPEYVQVRLLFAAAKANQQQYEDFFFHFFKAYTENQECFLAYRTLGILNIKLFEKARLVEEREERRNSVQKYLHLALKENMKDVALYKLLIVFSPPEARGNAVREVLEMIVQNNIQVPRSDISFYVNEAMSASEKEVAKVFLDKQATWYQYSRIIEEMRKVVSDDKNGNS
jgi:hypothetical protein